MQQKPSSPCIECTFDLILKPGVWRPQANVCWFLEIALVCVSVCVCVCLSVCPPPKPLTTIGMIWSDTDRVRLVKQVLWLFPLLSCFI